jgi:hypothetical protein
VGRVQNIKCVIIILAGRGRTRSEDSGFSFTSRTLICDEQRVLLACELKETVCNTVFKIMSENPKLTELH